MKYMYQAIAGSTDSEAVHREQQKPHTTHIKSAAVIVYQDEMF